MMALDNSIPEKPRGERSYLNSDHQRGYRYNNSKSNDFMKDEADSRRFLDFTRDEVSETLSMRGRIGYFKTLIKSFYFVLQGLSVPEMTDMLIYFP
jgi:hypothetical protein